VKSMFDVTIGVLPLSREREKKNLITRGSGAFPSQPGQ
jgi:hypothetical protein